jgi:agmatine deiminase
MSPPTPKELGYRMPAEWEPQAAVWLVWPHNAETWPGEALDDVRERFAEIVDLLHTGQRVSIVAADSALENDARRRLRQAGVDPEAVGFFRVANRDAWIRDYGPTFVRNDALRRLALVKWRFDAWGGKYEDLKPDDAVVARLNGYLGLDVFEAGLVLEGGSIDVNGCGSVLVTEQCLLNPNRNPQLTRRDLEARLGDYLDVSKVIWLGEGIAGDDTDGHVDDIARFVDPDTVVCAFEEDPADENYRALEDNYRRLTRSGLDVVKVPMPSRLEHAGARLPASYVNFYIGNRVVVVPVYGQPNDRRALSILESCFPTRRVVGVDSRAIVLGMGAIHCCSQQEPAV